MATRGAIALWVMLLSTCVALTGCGSGGYAGIGSSLSAMAIAIDAGQSVSVSSPFPGTLPVSWTITGSTCSGAACGTLSSTTGAAVTYTAPIGLASPLQVALQSQVSGTQDKQTVSVTVNPDPSISGNPNSGEVGVAYTTTLTATGGTAPLKLSIAAGSLPPGLTFNAQNGTISGTPTATGTYNFVAQVVDSSAVPNTISANESITIVAQGAALMVIGGNPPSGIVGTPYSAGLQASGGTQPYTWSIVAGSLPAGLTLSPSTGIISGVPTTQGTSPFTAQAQDSVGAKATGSFSITVGTSTTPLMLTVTSLPNGTTGVPYEATIGVSGGTSPYSCTITAGTLPAGLTLGAGCVVSGTPTAPGTANLTVKATDSSNPAGTTSGPVSLTIVPGPLILTVASLPNGTVGVPYNATIGVSGGTPPYSCTITNGTLPAGLTLGAGCVVSGTPTVSGTASLTVKAMDAGSPAKTTSGPVSLTIAPAGSMLAITSPPSATVGVPYSGTIGVSGGTAPYSCALTAGTLPAGLALASNCVVSGTPTTAGASTVTVKATDSSSPAGTTTGPVTITVNPATSTLTLASPPPATVGTPYTGTIGVSGGTAPYSCSVVSGTLPAGLTLGAGCVITGTPTTAGATNISVKATDSANPADTVTGPVTVTVQPMPALTFTGSLPNGTVGTPYLQTLHASGGIAPYTYAITAGALPAGLALSPTGVVSGTPTAVGASSFTVTATDSEATPQTASLPLVLLIVYPTTPNDALLLGPYAFLFQGYDDVTAGVLAYQTATVGSFNSNGAGVLSSGELDSNHQTSNPAGTTIASTAFLGTYTVGTDDRGTMTITTLNANGTTASTATYAIALKAPVAPSTISTRGDFIEFDNNSLQGTRGTGTLLAQQVSAFAAGLNGSYAFGVSGDTPCLPACTAGVSAGPAAAVGQFTTNGAGSITTGTGDANISTTNYASSALSGSYGAADGNGRIQLSMTTSNTPAGTYPTDYAVYMVSGAQAFVMSTDKHSTYVLLGGSAQLQTPNTFSTASMSGPYVGYENVATNPGQAGTTLQNVLNLSTAIIFRGTADAAGTCDTTNVDVGGNSGLVNGLTGIGSGAPILNALAGTYQSTGNSACTVAANGRGILNYPPPNAQLTTTLTMLGLPTTPPSPRVFYLFAPTQGYFLETGYAGLGEFDPQTGAPFSLATLDGTYIYGMPAASSLATTNSSGTFTADGAGNATYTLDENVGVGTINVLQPSTSGSSTYTLTDATAGRFLLGTSTVIYAITPNRFVLLDTSATTTSPSIVLLY
jgi:hypothetical protein